MSQFPPVDRASHVYFMASESGVLYLGVTSNLPVRQHKEKILPGGWPTLDPQERFWVAHPCGGLQGWGS